MKRHVFSEVVVYFRFKLTQGMYFQQQQMFFPELRKKPYSIKLDTVVLLLFFFQFLIGLNNFLCNNIFFKIIFYRAFIKTKFM